MVSRNDEPSLRGAGTLSDSRRQLCLPYLILRWMREQMKSVVVER